jgi:hypothetical protein
MLGALLAQVKPPYTVLAGSRNVLRSFGENRSGSTAWAGFLFNHLWRRQ